MPETTVQKMIGAITILISLMKPSPSALIQSLVAKRRPQPADERAEHDGDQHLNIENLVPGLCRAATGASVAIVAAMTFTPPQRSRISRATVQSRRNIAKILWAAGVNGVAARPTV